MRLFFFLLFISLSGYSQKIELDHFSEYKNSSLDTLTGKLYLYFSDHFETIDLKNLKTNSVELHQDESVSIQASPLNFTPVRIGPAVYFVHNSGGMLYTIEGGIIKRIDQSFDHQMEYGAMIFVHDKKIFKYGGYGFWSVRDFFTYFDFGHREWEIYHPDHSKVIPQEIYGAHHVKLGHELTIFGGLKLNPNNRREKFDNNEVWTYDLKNKEWDYKGKHESIERDLTSINYDSKKLIVTNNNVILIDMLSNKISTYEHSSLSAQIQGKSLLGFYKGKFLLITHSNGHFYLNLISKDEFFGALIKEDAFYQNTQDQLGRVLFYLLCFAAGILFVWLLIRGFKKRNKIKLLENGLRYRNKFTEFDAQSMAILNLMLSKPHVASNQILKIVEKQQYSPAHNERIKVQKIKDINLKIGTLLGSNESVIRNFKAENDRRIRVYTIKKSHFI